MEICKRGALRTLKDWEDLLRSLPEHAEGPEGLGRIWENEEPPRSEGQDPTIRQGWRLAVEHGVDFRPPKDARVVQVPVETSATGRAYTLVRVYSTAVHLHGVPIENGCASGDAHVCLRVVWPKGTDTREDDGVSRPWRNYILYVDMYPTDGPSRSRLTVHPEGTNRSPIIMVGSQELEERSGLEVTAWATRSSNWWPAEHGRRARPSTGTDQLITFSPSK